MPFWLLVLAALVAQIPTMDAPVQTQYSARYAEIRSGDGAPVEPAKVLVVHYTLWLTDGKKMDSSYDRGAPLSFEQGRRRVIPGWDAGFEGMRIGGKRRLFIPYQLAYGVKGRGPIPPKADLIFDVELLDVRDPAPLHIAAAPPGVKYQGISSDAPTGSPAISRDSLLAAYDMGMLTADGKLRDFSAAGKHADVTGTESVTGLFGAARRFTASKDRVSIPSSAEFSTDGPFSVAVWARPNRSGSRQQILACGGKFALWFGEDNKLHFTDGANDGYTAWDEIKQGEWHSIVGVFRGLKNVTVFVDGRELDGRLDPTWNPGKLREKIACSIGADFGGDIDEVLIWARPLSDAEVGTHAAR
jgi:hypothetical protein